MKLTRRVGRELGITMGDEVNNSYIILVSTVEYLLCLIAVQSYMHGVVSVVMCDCDSSGISEVCSFPMSFSSNSGLNTFVDRL